jgi:DNA repair ATPase RecN
MAIEERVLKLEEIVGALAVLAQKADRRLAQVDKQLAQADKHLAQTDDRLDKLTALAVRFDERLDALVAAQTNSDERMAALTNAQIRTEETLKETNEKLNNLIVVVERFISGRNGSS